MHTAQNYFNDFIFSNDFKITSIPIPFGSPVDIPKIGLKKFDISLYIMCIFEQINIRLYVYRYYWKSFRN